MDVYAARLSKPVEKKLPKIPVHIVFKLQSWIDGVRAEGLFHMRKIPGYHDEPLAGQRQGQRSIRLNRSWRAFYIIDKTGAVQCVEIIEVNKHEY
jgi:proteic killer suppression protein